MLGSKLTVTSIEIEKNFINQILNNNNTMPIILEPKQELIISFFLINNYFKNLEFNIIIHTTYTYHPDFTVLVNYGSDDNL